MNIQSPTLSRNGLKLVVLTDLLHDHDPTTSAENSRTGYSSVITVHIFNDVAPLITTLAEAGLSTCEITLCLEIGIEAIQIAASLQLDIAIGAGTVTSPDQVLAATEAGATFLVSPGLSQEVVRSAQQLEVPLIPGIATASELQAAA